MKSDHYPYYYYKIRPIPLIQYCAAFFLLVNFPVMCTSESSVQVYNGISENSPIIKSLCGDEVPEPVESSGHEMTVVFRTDGSVTNGVFKATWTSNNAKGNVCLCYARLRGYMSAWS